MKNRHQDVDIQFESRKRTMQRMKRGVLPSNPQTVDDINKAFENVDVMKGYGQTLHKNKNHAFFDGAVSTNEYSFCVFSSKATLEIIDEHIPIEERHILMDATFRICPHGPFNQILIFYIRKRSKVSIFSL